MIEAIQFYKKFIDDLASPLWSTSVGARHVSEWGKDIPKGYVTDETFNGLMEQFTAEQRQEIAGLVQGAYDEGMFNVLAYLSDEIFLKKVRISVDGAEIPVEPFGMTLYEDWIGRKSGEYVWPDERST